MVSLLLLSLILLLLYYGCDSPLHGQYTMSLILSFVHLRQKLPSDRRDFGNFQLMYDILPVTKFHVEAIVPTGENLGEEESRVRTLMQLAVVVS